MEADLPLAGVRVVDFTTTVAGPTCGGILSDLGATVLKIEPPGGEMLRNIVKLNTGKEGPWPPFVAINRGKQSVALDTAGSEEASAGGHGSEHAMRVVLQGRSGGDDGAANPQARTPQSRPGRRCDVWSRAPTCF